MDDGGFKVSNYIKINDKVVKLDVRYVGDGYFDTNWQKNILNNRRYYKGFYVPNKENFIYAIIYHIVYHKGYIDKKYIDFLKKNLQMKVIDFTKIVEIINKYLKLKKYNITRPLDLTIPVTYQLDNFSIKNEIQLVKKQIDIRNFSGANKMIYNIIKFQKSYIYLNFDVFSIILFNLYNLIKSKFKNFFFKYFNKNE